MNAAETRCGPALTAIGGVCRFMPFGSDSLIRGLMSSSATRCAVDRDLDLLAAGGAAVQLPGRDRVQHHPEGVVAVGREVVDDRDAAARAERRAFDVRELRRHARHLVDRRVRRWRSGSPTASRLTCDARAQVALEQRRRHRLHVGDVVEVVADGVGRQERRRRRRRAPSRSLDRRRRTRRGSGAGTCGGPGSGARSATASSFVSSDAASASSVGVGGPLGAGRRHHAGAQLPDHLLGDVGALLRLRGIEGLEDEVPFSLSLSWHSRQDLLDDDARPVERARRRVRGTGRRPAGAGRAPRDAIASTATTPRTRTGSRPIYASRQGPPPGSRSSAKYTGSAGSATRIGCSGLPLGVEKGLGLLDGASIFMSNARSELKTSRAGRGLSLQCGGR